MTTILVDHDIEGYGYDLLGVLAKEGWLEIVDIRIITFAEAGLPHNSTDRTIWRFAQANEMILLTNNRNMEDKDSLEQTLREENTLTSLPVVTIGNLQRLSQRVYRERCAAHLLEIIVELPTYLGRRRVFIPLR